MLMFQKWKYQKWQNNVFNRSFFHKENVYVTFISQIALLSFVYITHINKNKYLTLPNAKKVVQNKSILDKYWQKLNGLSFCFSGNRSFKLSSKFSYFFL